VTPRLCLEWGFCAEPALTWEVLAEVEHTNELLDVRVWHLGIDMDECIVQLERRTTPDEGRHYSGSSMKWRSAIFTQARATASKRCAQELPIRRGDEDGRDDHDDDRGEIGGNEHSDQVCSPHKDENTEPVALSSATSGDLPLWALRPFASDLLKQHRPTRAPCSVHTGGGIGAEVEVGDVIVSRFITFDCQRGFKKHNGDTYASTADRAAVSSARAGNTRRVATRCRARVRSRSSACMACS
jgi:hypothetical protein